MKSAGAPNGVLTICMAIVGSAIALGGLILISQSNLRADFRAEIAINRADIAANRSAIAEVRRDLSDLRADVARMEGSLLARESSVPSAGASTLTD
ncbi:MAG: hypothetical protein OXF03_08105 [Gammaproteobacteria bacterium]|nr:hypothetical protein [Gammaproteobacteria bacterium]MCY4340804.1 hypothetical protein [Gammaproteobacteria bacterium]